MHATRRSRPWLRRVALVPILVLALSGTATFATTTAASAMPAGGWCDYVAERGIFASSDYWVGYWWTIGHAHGCW